MALTVRTNGSGGSNIIAAAWWNDYYNLLTGAMTDQPVTLSYAPGSAGSTPTLKLVTNGNADLLQGFNGATEQFSINSIGAAYQGAHPYVVMLATGTATAGRQLFTGTTTPTGANEGDIWVKA